ncbi:response regulator [Ideonella sp. DXS29W]|uniref:Response regulator n=1 Tax=Ideonella lacteola TaxID=2984193 RepID=A0ABU9BIX1_9BURK
MELDMYGRPGRPQVLYVEDEPTNALLMQALFRLRPHLDLVVASSGSEAAALAANIRPALLMLDMRLPDVWGSDLLPELRRRYHWRQVPAVAVTAERHFDGRRCGFVETWYKPLDLQRVLQRLDQWLPDPQRQPALLQTRRPESRAV